MKRPSKRSVCLGVALTAIVLLMLCEIVCPSCLLGDEISDSVAQSIDMIVTRFLGGVAFLAMLVNLGYRVLNPIKKPFLVKRLSLVVKIISLRISPKETILSIWLQLLSQ